MQPVPTIAAALTLFLLAAPALSAAAKKADPEATQALLAAAAESEADDILAALAKGADPLAKDGQGNNALMLAVMGSLWGNQEKVIDALLAAKVPVDAKNAGGQTALMLAAREGRHDNVKTLIARGAQVDARDGDGWTPLMLAAYNGQTFALDALLGAKADVRVKTSDGTWDALTLALSEGRGGAAERLLAAGATVPASPVNGLTPLVHAVYGADLKSVRLVLATKPDLGARDADGWSALEIAANNGYPQIVMELLRAGIDPSLKDKEGKTALDRAQMREHAEIVALLGGPWNRPATGGTKVAIPCPVLGGDVEAAFEVRGEDLVVTTTYPKPLAYYLGGGHTNRADSAVKHTYDGSMAPAYHFDTDRNPRTGRKAEMLEKEVAGSEYTLDYMEYGTSVVVSYPGPEGEELSKQVYANVLGADLTKMGESIPQETLGDYMPEAANNSGALETTIPLSILGVKKGQQVRVVAAVGSCKPKEATVRL